MSKHGSNAFFEAVRVALGSLRASKLRSFLTLPGIILATTTLIAVMSLIHGMDVYIAEKVSDMGADGVYRGLGCEEVSGVTKEESGVAAGGVRVHSREGDAGDVCDVVDWIAGGRNWSDEHYARQRDGADARDWSEEGAGGEES